MPTNEAAQRPLNVAAVAAAAAVTLPEIMKAGAVKAQITSVAKTSHSLTANIQALLIQCAMHAERHGDITLMGRLLGGNVDGEAVSVSPLGGIVRAKGLKVYIETYTPLRWNGDHKLGIQKQDAKTYTPFNVAGMVETPFYAEPATAERTAKPLEFEALFSTFIKRAERELKVVQDETKPFNGDRNAAAVRLREIIKTASAA